VAPPRALGRDGGISQWRRSDGHGDARVIADRGVERVPQQSFWQRAPGLRLAALIVVALLGGWQLLTALQTSPFAWHDFTQDYVAAEDVLAGRNPYRPQNERIRQLFNIPAPKEGPAYSFHPPSTIPFFLPIALLPYPVAFIVWDILQVGCLGVIVYVTANALGRPLAPLTLVALTLGLIAVWPLRENFVEGQLNVAVTAGIAGCWYALRSRRPVLAGIALATAVALKPLVGLFILWAVWRREWRLLVATGVTLAVYGLVGIGLAGFQGTLDYITMAYQMHAELWPGYQDNASPQGFYTRLFGPSPWRPRPPYPMAGLAQGLTLTTWVAAVALLFWRIGWRRPDAERLNREFAALGATMLLVTPIIWPHYYVVLVAPVAVMAAYLWRRQTRWLLLVLALALLVLWVPRDLFQWISRSDLAPRTMGSFLLPALLAMYGLGLAGLGRRPGPVETPPGAEL